MKTALILTFAFIVNVLYVSVSTAQLSDALMLTVSNGNYSDQTAVRFLDDATNNFDSDYDAYKLSNGGLTPNFSSYINNLNYAINALQGSGKKINQTVSLNLDVAFSGDYIITAEEIGLFDSKCTIVLIDKLLNIKQDLKANPTYNFSFNVGDPIDRFTLSFNVKSNDVPNTISSNSVAAATFTTAVSDTQMQDQTVNIFNSEGKILVKVNQTQAPILVNISDLAGNTVASTTINNATQWEYSALQHELYIVSLVVDGVMHTEKVFVQ